MIDATQVRLRDQKGDDLFSSNALCMSFSLRKIFRGRLLPRWLYIDSPSITIKAPREKNGNFPLHYLNPAYLFPVTGLRNVSIRRGKICFQWSQYYIKELEMRIMSQHGIDQGRDIFCKGVLAGKALSVPFTISGQVHDPETKCGMDLAKVQILTGPVPVKLLNITENVVPDTGKAKVKLDLALKKGNRLVAKGRAYGHEIRFWIVKGKDRKEFSFPVVDFQFFAELANNNLTVPSFEFAGTNFIIDGDFNYDFRKDKPQNISLTVSTPYMTLRAFKKLFPDPLISDWVSRKLFPQLSSGMVKVNVFSLDGTLDQIRELDQSQNAGAISFDVVWKDLVGFEKAMPYHLEDNSGHLTIRNGRLEIKDLKGVCGRSKITDAFVIVPSLYDDWVKVKVSSTGEAELKELFHIGKTLSQGEFFPEALSKIGDISGRMKFMVKGMWDQKTDGIQIDQEEFDIDNCSFFYENYKPRIVLKKAKVKGRRGFGHHVSGKGRWQDTDFDLVACGDDALNAVRLSIWGNLQIRQVLESLMIKVPFSLETNGKNAFFMSIRKNKKAAIGEVRLALHGLKVSTPYVAWESLQEDDALLLRFDWNGQYGADRLSVDELVVYVGNSCIEGYGNYGIEKKNVLQFFANGADIEVSSTGIRWKNWPRLENGKLSFNLLVKTNLNNFNKSSVTGFIRAKNISMSTPGPTPHINGLNLDVSFNKRVVELNYLEMQMGKTTFNISGKVRGWERLAGTLNIHANKIKIDYLLALIKDMVRGNEPSKMDKVISRSNINVNIVIESCSYNGCQFGPVKSKLLFKYGNLFIDKFRAYAPHGKMALLGYIKRGAQAECFFSTHIKFNKQPVQQLLVAIGAKEPLIEGELTGEAIVYSRAKEPKGLIQGLNGAINILLEKGKILKSNVIIKVLDFLSLQGIFVRKPPDLSKEGFYYSKIEGSFQITNGVLESKNIIMRSPVFNAAYKGKLNLVTRELDSNLGVHPFGTLDSLLDKIPIVGYILMGDEKALIVYYFTVKGKIPEVEVNHVPLKDMALNTLFFLKRVFMTPVKVYQDIKKFVENLTEEGVPMPAEEDFGVFQ